MWVFQSYTNPAHKCDVKCFIAIQHLRERSTFSISSPKSQRAVNISLQQSNISEIGQHSHQAVQHLRERSTFSSSCPTSQREINILIKLSNISVSGQHSPPEVQILVYLTSMMLSEKKNPDHVKTK